MITRDGALTSLWQHSAAPYKPVNNPVRKTTHDVLIVGGGITGITLALKLQEAGLQCLLLEAETLCFGTTGGTTAHLNTLLDTPYTTVIKKFGEEKATLLADAAKDAIQLIKDNIANYGIDCEFEETDAFLFSQDEDQSKELQKILEACNTVHVDASYTVGIPVPIPFEKAIKVPGQAKFNPVKYVFALAEAFEKAGGIIVQQSRVAKAESRTDTLDGTELVDVETVNGKHYIGRAIVYATHVAMGVNILHFRCAPYRSYAMAFELEPDGYPEGLAYDMYDPYHYYRTQMMDGKLIFIAGGEDHKTAHEENTDACFKKLEAHVRKYFKVRAVTHRWSSQYFEPADGLPYIGNEPGSGATNSYVATGFGGNGMIYSQVAALCISELIVHGKSKWADLFSPSRVKPIAGFENFVKEAADTVKHLFDQLFSHHELNALVELANDEGKVVDYEGKKMALYKDEQGGLHALSTACTHINCEVGWNSAEKSWDCACHGSRFNIDGAVLSGPAYKPLAKIKLRELLKEKS